MPPMPQRPRRAGFIGPPLGLAVAALWSPGIALIAGGATLMLGTIAFAAQPAARRFSPAARSGSRRGGIVRNAAVLTLVLAVAGVGVLFGAAELGVTAVATNGGGPSTVAPLLGIRGGGGLIGGVSPAVSAVVRVTPAGSPRSSPPSPRATSPSR